MLAGKEIRGLGTSQPTGFRQDQSPRKVFSLLTILFFLFFLVLLISSLPHFGLPETLYARESAGRVKATRVSRQTDLL